MSKKKCITGPDVIKIYRKDLDTLFGKTLLVLCGVVLIAGLGFLIRQGGMREGCRKFVDYNFQCDSVLAGEIEPYKVLSNEIKNDILKAHSN